MTDTPDATPDPIGDIENPDTPPEFDGMLLELVDILNEPEGGAPRNHRLGRWFCD